ncbi:MAG TPA: PfkB family carbohydrate kinase [Spirochaetia bacterium]|nr:PfkB family carbohydrate kinase [Spirochaetia bacterium]
MPDLPAIAVSGALAYDDTYLYPGRIKDHLPEDRGAPLYLNFRAQGPARSRGGCGGNVAYSLASLQAPVVLHGWIGRDGEPYLAEMRQLGVNVDRVRIEPDVLTSRAVLLADAAGDQVLFFGEPEREVAAPETDLRGVRLAVVTAGTPSHTRMFLAACRAARVPVVVDPGKLIMDMPAEAMREAITGADSLVLNEYEHGLLRERLRMTEAELRGCASTIVVTRGGQGMDVVSEGREDRIRPVPPAVLTDPNGAGDAFLAGYSFGRHRGLSGAWSARVGAVAASFALEASGCQNHGWTAERFASRLADAYGTPPFPSGVT